MKKQLLTIASLGVFTGMTAPLIAQTTDMDSQTTTTTQVADSAPPVEQQDTTVTTTRPVIAVGTVSALSDGTIVIRTTQDAPVTRYYYSKSTRYVDADGNVVSASTVKSGAPISVEYTRIGDRMVASKVTVKRVHVRHTEASDNGSAVEQRTTITDSGEVQAPAPPPVVIKKTTTTTTNSDGN